MTLDRIYLIAILLLTFVVCANGQAIDEESNWFKEIGRHDDHYSRFDFTKYTKEDIQKAKSKYFQISAVHTNDEWAGLYSIGTMLGHSEIVWNREQGFVYNYVYHTLANIDYGNIVATDDSVWFQSDRFKNKKQKRFFEVEYTKVKFGEKHLLVPKSRLSDFAVAAAGLEVPHGRGKREIEAGFFWEKVQDKDKKTVGVLTYPTKYAHLIQNPILLTVLTVGKLRIKRETSKDWDTTSVEHLRTLTLSRGRNNGVRMGMRFWINDLEEWVEIVSVRSNRAAAELSRPFIDGREYCDSYENYSQVEFPCRDPKIGMTARTKTEYF